MRWTRSFGAVLVAMSLGGVFVAAAGFAADDQPTATYPEPQPGDTAYYHIKDIIDDPDAVLGPMHYDWSALSWGAPTTLVDAAGAVQSVLPLRYHTMYAQGQSYEWETVREVYVGQQAPVAERWLRDNGWNSYGGIGPQELKDVLGDDATLGEVPATSGVVETTLYQGPMGLCGAVAPIQGGAAPARMEVYGFCRPDRIMGDDRTTTYRQVETTEWRGRTAVVYQPVDGPDWRLVYAAGVPFPVEVEVPLSETVYDPWEVGRHFRFELQGFTRDGAPAQLGPPVAGGPLPVTERVAGFHLDESNIDQPGLLLGEAYRLAMADPAAPRLADFMAQQGAYLGAGWRSHYVDSDGRVTTAWHLVATTGDAILAKSVYRERTVPLLDLDALYADRVEDYPGQLSTGRYPAKQALPAEVTSLPEAMERHRLYMPETSAPDSWGFYHACRNEACTETQFMVRIGHEQLPDGATSFETNPDPSYYQRNVFINEDGLVSHTFRFVAFGDEDRLIATPRPLQQAPAEPAQERQAAVWSPPGAEAATSMGVVALLGGLLFYFWPALKSGAVGMFSRIHKDKVLNHPLRQAIVDAATEEPGVHFQALVRRLSVGRGTLEHHLQRLLTNGYLVEQTGGGYTCYFLAGQLDRRLMAAAAALKAPVARRLLEAVLDDPGSSGRHMAQRLGIAPSTVSHHVQRLQSAGLIEKQRGLWPTDLSRAALA